MVRRAGAEQACGPAPDTPRAAAPGRRSPCPTSLPRYQRRGRSAPGCPPRSPSRTRPRTGRSAPVRLAWGWAGGSTELRGTAAPPGI